MYKLKIQGGQRLQGEVVISGAKNAALPEICAALLTAEPFVLRNVPRLQDVDTMLNLLRGMGVQVQWTSPSNDDEQSHELELNAKNITSLEAPYDLVKTMRASILVLGPLLSRFGKAKVSLPGGCAIGARPVEQHIKGLQAMGAEISVEHGYIVASAKRLQGARIRTDMVTVTGTENLLMSAVLAQGETVLENAAKEPEVVDLAELLIKMGAKIEGHGTDVIKIQGVDALHGCTHEVIPDRIEAGTFLCAVAATGGSVVLRNVNANHMGALLDKLRSAGAQIEVGENFIKIAANQRMLAQDFVTTEYPGFPTDMQAQFMALNCTAQGNSMVEETIFENRFMHVNELLRLGARIGINGRKASIEGVDTLQGATVMATDLRASASLVIAGLVAEGETIVDRIYHLDRGYDRMENKLRQLGAMIERVNS